MIVLKKRIEQLCNGDVSSKLRFIIVILSVLLVLTAGALVGRVVYLKWFAVQGTTTIVPDNLISEDPEASVPKRNLSNSNYRMTPVTSSSPGSRVQNMDNTHLVSTTNTNTEDKNTVKLSLYKNKTSDNEKFEVKNMFPGDTEIKYFCVKASHNADITLYFDTKVTAETKNLGNILHIRVTHIETENVLFDGTFQEINNQQFTEVLQKNASNETKANFKIEVSLPTSAGNEYQAAMLKANFRWYVEDEEHMMPPQTGDNHSILLWSVGLASSLALICLLLFYKRREKEELLSS